MIARTSTVRPVRRCRRARRLGLAGPRAAHVPERVAHGRRHDVEPGQPDRRQDALPGGRLHQQEQARPAGHRDPGRGQEQQRDLPAEVLRQQHRRLRRARAFQRQLQGARAQQPGPGDARVRARLQPGRPAGGAQVPRHGQGQDDEVRRQVRHPEDGAGRRPRRRASTAARSARWRGCSARSRDRAAALRRARWAAPPSARCTAARPRACG